MVTKGSLQTILDVCQFVAIEGEPIAPLDNYRVTIQQTFQELSTKGFRTLGLAIKNTSGKRTIDKSDEVGMTFLVFLLVCLIHRKREYTKHWGRYRNWVSKSR